MLRYFSDIVTLKLNRDKCTDCGLCWTVCPHGVFAEAADQKAQIVDKDACMECGACARNCAYGAIYVKANVGCAVAHMNMLKLRKGKPISEACD